MEMQNVQSVAVILLAIFGNRILAMQFYQPNSVQDFVRQLTNFLNEGSSIMRPNDQFPPNKFPSQTTNYLQDQTSYPFPYPPPQYPGFSDTSLHTDQSFIGALSTIARNDDLRCVPRILCQITAGTLPEKSSSSSNHKQSIPPFFSKDALITLLTVLNFVDDSPLLSFGRAALLGYTSRGDDKSCLAAYPTCPKNPDQLVNYLNNHNGGFFKFFNQARKLPSPLHQYSPNIQYALDNQNYISKRILNSPVDIVPESEIKQLQINNFPTRENKRIVFPVDDDRAPTNGGVASQYTFAPNRVGKSSKYKPAMVFPLNDDTSTSNNEVYVPDDRKAIPSKVTFADIKFVPHYIKITRYPFSNFRFEED